MANTVIKIKKSGATGNVPTSLEYGELSLNYTDKKLFFQNGPASIKNFSADVFNAVSANSTLVLATTSDDILTLTPNNGISIVGDAGSKRVYIGVNENQIGSFVKKSGDTMTGNLNVPTANVIANTVIFYKEIITELGTRFGTPLPNLVAQFTSNSSSYIQVNAENIDPKGSADYVVTGDVGNDESFFIDMGILNSQYDPNNPLNSLGTAAEPLDGYLYVHGSTINQPGGSLVIGTVSTEYPTEVRIIAGGVNAENVVTTFARTNTTIKNRLIVNKDITINANTAIASNTKTTSSATQTTIDSFSKSIYRSAKYEVQVTSGSNYHVIELRIMHDGVTAYMAQYGEMYTSVPLGAFDADISGDNFNLLFTPTNSINTIKLTRSAIAI
jgi:hypothetical protein